MRAAEDRGERSVPCTKANLDLDLKDPHEQHPTPTPTPQRTPIRSPDGERALGRANGPWVLESVNWRAFNLVKMESGCQSTSLLRNSTGGESVVESLEKVGEAQRSTRNRGC